MLASVHAPPRRSSVPLFRSWRWALPVCWRSVPQSDLLQSADATLVRDFLVRRSTIDDTTRTDLAQRLASAIAHRYSLPFDTDPEAFLERLV
jgi:hypothetical protein